MLMVSLTLHSTFYYNPSSFCGGRKRSGAERRGFKGKRVVACVSCVVAWLGFN